MNIIKRLFLILLYIATIAIASCNESYFVEYQVKNNSDRVLLIDFVKENSIDTNFNLLSPGFDLIFLIEQGDDDNLEDYLNSIEELPLTFNRFEDMEGNLLNCDVQNIVCWDKVSNNDNTGEISIRIRENSFE